MLVVALSPLYDMSGGDVIGLFGLVMMVMILWWAISKFR